jgi:hypothetical protein
VDGSVREKEMEMARGLREAVAAKNRAPVNLKAVIGLDGFIDEIVHVVDMRKNHDEYTRLDSMAAYADRIRSYAGMSGNIEYVTQRIKIGGNGPIMANAIASLDVTTTYIGNIGRPEVNPVFRPMEELVELISLAEPCHTDAVEFHDGKIMVGKMSPVKEVRWERLMEVVGLERLTELLDGADLLALVNWSMLPYMPDIWERLLEDVCPKLDPERERFVFFDLADPQKRSAEDVKRMLSLVQQFSDFYRVIFGLNRREAYQIAKVLGIQAPEDAPGKVEKVCEAIAGRLGIYCMVVHPVEFAVATIRGNTYRQEGPHTKRPVIPTGAGDHFNAAFCLGNVLGVDPQTRLLMGVCCSGCYVMTGRTPDLSELMAFMENWRDDPFGLMARPARA